MTEWIREPELSKNAIKRKVDLYFYGIFFASAVLQ
jgi:hypothetical protein